MILQSGMRQECLIPESSQVCPLLILYSIGLVLVFCPHSTGLECGQKGIKVVSIVSHKTDKKDKTDKPDKTDRTDKTD